MKTATTVEQQIEMLKSREMRIDINEDKAKEILGDIGYFRLGFYCFPFETSYPDKKHRTHQYKQNSQFSDVVALYYLDSDLRKILSICLNRVEINFRTNIIYTVSNQYLDSNTWFIDPTVMEKTFIEDFDKEHYTDKFRRNPIIQRHHNKHINDKYAPAWKTLEFFTFGTMVNLYKNLKDKSLRLRIAAKYGIRNDKVLENYFNTLVEIRNICAHNAVLFDHNLYRELKNGPAFKITSGNGYQIFPAIKVIWFILNSISQNRANDLKNEIISLFDKYNDNESIHYIIENCTGYKNNF
ncbi:MAG: Abi family protein [Prevotellaceae bacterium]|jgi:abortive infection bacteriophage resistance protein|nr:Abi family protein [Prevotellaceae bacterium]